MNISMKDIAIITIIIMKGAKRKSMASALSSTTAVRLSTFTNSTTSSPPDGAVNIIRAKGVCYFSHNRDMSYLFEQAGAQKQLTEAGLVVCHSTPKKT